MFEKQMQILPLRYAQRQDDSTGVKDENATADPSTACATPPQRRRPVVGDPGRRTPVGMTDVVRFVGVELGVAEGLFPLPDSLPRFTRRLRCGRTRGWRIRFRRGSAR